MAYIDDDRYSAKRRREAERNREASESGRDIGPIPPVANPERRAAAAESLRVFCETYLRGTFDLAWSDDHLRVIATLEQVVKVGGRYALAMPRSSGKTALTRAAAMWAVLNGYRRFVVAIAATGRHATRLLNQIKMELECNDLLHDDYPEVCYPIGKLERIANRQRGQTCCGEPTYIGWTKDAITLPTISGSDASGAVLQAAGLTGAIRGMQATTPDGKTIRPDCVLLDDPQTDKTAKSVTQNEEREELISGAVLGLAGPKTQISAIMPCTVIKPGDMVDRMLDHDLHPEWNGERTRLLYEFPTRMDLWEQYQELKVRSYRLYKDQRLATDFYRKHQEEMDEGAVVAWPARYEPHQLSAVQYALDLFLEKPSRFYAEYQNDPGAGLAIESEFPGSKEIRAKRNGLPRGTVPLSANIVTAFIDVQGKLLYWTVCAWAQDLTGAVIDYGTYPDQGRTYFTLRDAKKTLAKAHPRMGDQGRIYAGLMALTEDLLAREWQREDGMTFRIQRCLIDSGWGNSSDTVYQVCRASPHAALLAPSKGRGITASMLPLSEYKVREGEVIGHEWVVAALPKHGVRLVSYDTNYWKTHVLRCLGIALGDRGGISLFEREPHGRSSIDHKMFADHMTSELYEKKKGRGGREIYEFAKATGDNHWLDCLVGSAVAASLHGCQPLSGQVQAAAAGPKRKKRKRRADYL